jgi:hypothetical protein
MSGGSSFFEIFWQDGLDEPFTCRGLGALARGWLSLMSCIVFAGPAMVMALAALTVTAVLYVSLYVFLVLPCLCCLKGDDAKIFPDAVSYGEYGCSLLENVLLQFH